MISTPGDGKNLPPEWQRQKERGSLFWLRVMSRLSLLFGRRASRTLLHGIALYFLLAVPGARKAARASLARMLGRPVGWHDLYRNVFAFASTIHDRTYLLNDRCDLFDIRTTGTDALHAVHATGNGCLLFGAHLGSFEILRGIARDHGDLKVTAAMYPENARRLNDTLAAINPDVILDVIALGRFDALLAIHQRLEEGAMVGVLADRASGRDTYIPMPFLGATAGFPSGPFRLAAMLRRPVFFMSGLYRGGNRYDIRFELLEDFAGPTAGRREEIARRLLEKYVDALERHACSAPYNWFNFYDFWNTI